MAAPAARWQLLVVLAAVLLVRLPFLNQAIQGDDFYYLAGAEHAQIDPWHPLHARYVFLGEMVDMRGHSHPPLNSWLLAGLLAAFGDIHEVAFHAAYALLSIVAALAMWSLAKRFSPRPLLATLLFVATPVFVVNGNSLEADLPFIAFWLAGIALFVRCSSASLAAAAVLLGLAGLAAYQAVVVIPILAVYLFLFARRRWAGWLVCAAPALSLAAWQVFELVSAGAAPASVLAGYFGTHGFQALANKLTNAAALTAHTGWLVFPVLPLAFWPQLGRARWIAVGGALGAAVIDPHPLFWASFGIGLLVVVYCARAAARRIDPGTRFLAAWVLIFFAAALVLFFAGSARYLLPIAAPVVLLVSRSLAGRPRWLAAGFATQLAVSLALATVNYQHWDGYRQFARSLAKEAGDRRVWINADWGLRYYFEALGGLPLVESQAVLPGDMVVSSRLALPIPFTTGGGFPVRTAQREIRATLPFRLIALGARSAYSTASLGLRPFDFATGPIDVVRAETVVPRPPTLSYLPMNAPEADRQIVSGIYGLEGGKQRWMGERGTVLLKSPAGPLALQVEFYIHEQAPARRVSLVLDGRTVAERSYPGAGSYTLRTAAAVSAFRATATVTVVVDRTFSVPGDRRHLGIVLSAVGFR